MSRKGNRKSGEKRMRGECLSSHVQEKEGQRMTVYLLRVVSIILAVVTFPLSLCCVLRSRAPDPDRQEKRSLLEQIVVKVRRQTAQPPESVTLGKEEQQDQLQIIVCSGRTDGFH